MVEISPLSTYLIPNLSFSFSHQHDTKVSLETNLPELFKGWVALASGKITLLRNSAIKIDWAIRWILIYPVDIAIHPFEQLGPGY